MEKLQMKKCNKILIQKLQISTLSPSIVDKYDYLTGKGILLPDHQSRIES